MILVGAVGFLLDHWLAWRSATLVGLLLGLWIAPFVPSTDACGVGERARRPPAPPGPA